MALTLGHQGELLRKTNNLGLPCYVFSYLTCRSPLGQQQTKAEIWGGG